MDSGHGKMRMNVDGDRLSSLPDDLIHKILSFRPVKDAIRTSVLSSRWRYIWTSLPYLSFSSENFSTLRDFSRFVNHVLSGRNNQTEVYSVKLSFRGKASQVFVKRILNYAFSHNIQQLDVVCLDDKNIEFPLSLFGSQSLKHLTLAAKINPRLHEIVYRHYFINPTLTRELLTLTTLDLHHVTMCDDEADKCSGIFSKCPNLKDLSLKEFTTTGVNSFSIFHPRLSNLTLENSCGVKVVNVVAPQLENLTIRSCEVEEHVISAPHLASLFYKGSFPLRLATEGFNYLKKADICVSHPEFAAAHKIVYLLQSFHNVHFLTLSLEIVETLSSSVDLILPQPSPFVNLKSLKIYPERIEDRYKQAHKKVTMSAKLKSYLLDGSPGSTFTMVLREEVQAQKMMAKLLVLLKKNKDNWKANSDRLEQGTTPAEPKPKKLKIVGAHIKNSLENMRVQIFHAGLFFSKLQHIEEILTTLPASNRAKIQPSYSRLCAEANIALNKITDCIKIQCDENQSRSNVYFHELATIMEPSS